MNTLYKDSLIEITDEALVLRQYYFPSGGDRRIAFGDIESLRVEPLRFGNGRYRLWGTGDFRTWFPNDGGRMGRDLVFLLRLRAPAPREPWWRRVLQASTGGAYRSIGFTARDARRVEEVLRAKGLLPNEPVE